MSKENEGQKERIQDNRTRRKRVYGKKKSGTNSIPVYRDATRAAVGDADTPIGFPLQPLESALVFTQEWFKFLQAPFVVVLSHRSAMTYPQSETLDESAPSTTGAPPL